MCDSFTEIEKAIYNTTKYGYKKKRNGENYRE